MAGNVVDGLVLLVTGVQLYNNQITATEVTIYAAFGVIGFFGTIGAGIGATRFIGKLGMNILVVIPYLKSQDSVMNFLIVILNRIYLFLTRVRNQSPLFGSVTLVTILLSFTLLNLIGFYCTFKTEPIIINIPFFLYFNLLIFIPIFFYAKRNKVLVLEKDIPSPKLKNLIVILIYLFTAVSTIYLANINRDKISKQSRKEQSLTPRKESLEGKIRKWFE